MGGFFNFSPSAHKDAADSPSYARTFAARRKRLLDKIKSVSAIQTWQLILILIPLLFLAATFLRFDHLKMTELRAAVLQADQDNDDQKIAEHLFKLRQYTNSHIIFNVVEENGLEKIVFGTGPFYLENQYTRKATAEIAKAEQRLSETGNSNPNGNVFAKAMEVCKPQAIAGGWAWNSPEYLSCMTGEIAKYPTTDSLDSTFAVKIPSTELYRYDFASPVWAPTLAGFTILLCIILIVVIFIRAIIWCVLRLALLFLKNT